MDILMSVNRAYTSQMMTVLCSLGQNCDCNVNIYLIHNELPKNKIERIRKIVKNHCRGKLYDIKIDKEFISGAKVNDHFSIEMYYRIFATEFLPENLERILWIDADTVVLKDLSQFFVMDMEGHSIVACAHRERSRKEHWVNDDGVNRLGLGANAVYFNSGVLLMDLRKIREKFNKKEAVDLIFEKEKILVNPDQDILNLLYEKDVKIVDWKKYNYQTHFDWKFNNEEQHLKNNAYIIHYVGPLKPWGYNSQHFSYAFYWKYYLLHGSRCVYYTNRFMRFVYIMKSKIRRTIK